MKGLRLLFSHPSLEHGQAFSSRITAVAPRALPHGEWSPGDEPQGFGMAIPSRAAGNWDVGWPFPAEPQGSEMAIPGGQ